MKNANEHSAGTPGTPPIMRLHPDDIALIAEAVAGVIAPSTSRAEMTAEPHTGNSIYDNPEMHKFGSLQRAAEMIGMSYDTLAKISNKLPWGRNKQILPIDVYEFVRNRERLPLAHRRGAVAKFYKAKKKTVFNK